MCVWGGENMASGGKARYAGHWEEGKYTKGALLAHKLSHYTEPLVQELIHIVHIYILYICNMII